MRWQARLTDTACRIAFVEFATLDEATRAVEEMHGELLMDRPLAVHYSINKERKSRPSRPAQNAPSATLFVGNISFDMPDKELNDLFLSIDDVTDVRVAVDRRTGQPRGYAHADFTDVASAQRAYDLLQGKEVWGRPLRCDYSTTTRTARQTSSETSEME